MDQQHLIDRAVFNTTFVGSAALAEQRHEMDDFLRRQVLSVIEEVFDQQTEGPENILRIDRLEIDLGEITLEDFRQQLPARLRERLRAALHEQRHLATTRLPAAARLTDRQGSLMQELRFFLEHGFLPWYSRPRDNEMIAAEFERILRHAPQDLVHLLAQRQDRPRILERLQKQFSPAAIDRIKRLLAAPPEHETSATAEPDRGQATFASPLLQRVAPSSWRDLEPAMLQLLDAILAGETDTIEARWSVLITAQPAALARALRRIGRQPLVRRSIAAGFAAPLFEQLLRLLEPADIETLLFLSAIFVQVLQAETGLPSARIEQELREFILQYLLDERGNIFASRDYLASLLRQLTTLYPVREDRLADIVAQQIRSGAGQGSVAHDLGDLLRQLSAQSPMVPSADAVPGPAATRKTVEPRARFDRLARLLTGADDQPHEMPSTLFEDLRALRQAAPGLLPMLLAELRGADRSRLRALAQLSLGELAELCAALLTRQPGKAAEVGDANELEQTFYRYFARVRGKREFLLRFVEQWSSNAPVDFTALARAPETTPSSMKPAPGQDARPGGTEHTDLPDSQASEADDLIEEIYVANAGAVIVAPYLPHLFERLGYIERGSFKSRDMAERAVHCVQYLVNEHLSSPEYELVLNKVLCGVKPGLPICRGIDLDASELDQLDTLLESVIQHWQALGNTTVEGLRTAFLQRNGRLQRKQNEWQLSVEGKPYDMLLDQVPWTYSIIKFPWMEQVLYVEWR